MNRNALGSERRNVAALICAALALALSNGSARADAAQPYGQVATLPDPYHELETKYLFGFTEGADIGAEGEQSVEFETTTTFGRRGGSYGAVEQEIEYEGVPSQFFGFELSAHGFGDSLRNVDGIANASGVNFMGLSTELRYLVIGRGPESPFGLTLVAEPEWDRIDSDGRPAVDLSTTFRAIVDTELVPNRVYGAINLTYAPDYAQSPGQPWQESSTWGASAAVAARVAPKVTLGGEAEVFGAYDSFGFQSFQGEALYLGPTLQIQFTGKIMLAAAWSSEVAGHANGERYGLDLTNFPQQRGNLKLEFEF